jgi:hypothetical protein
MMQGKAKSSQKTEKRKHPRFFIRNKAFAVVRPRGNQTDQIRVGKIKNISTDGLALEYPSDGDLGNEPSYVDIFIPHGRFHLGMLPCRFVYDIQTQGAYITSVFISSYVTKQCGMQFENLSEEMATQLDLFLRNATEA